MRISYRHYGILFFKHLQTVNDLFRHQMLHEIFPNQKKIFIVKKFITKYFLMRPDISLRWRKKENTIFVVRRSTTKHFPLEIFRVVREESSNDKYPILSFTSSQQIFGHIKKDFGMNFPQTIWIISVAGCIQDIFPVLPTGANGKCVTNQKIRCELSSWDRPLYWTEF